MSKKWHKKRQKNGIYLLQEKKDCRQQVRVKLKRSDIGFISSYIPIWTIFSKLG